jgi:ferredoxin-thioredoxin reductase catalytic subunit
MNNTEISQEAINELYEQLNIDAQAYGYHLNPDPEVTRALVNGLLINEKRYDYRACPCRLASGVKEQDIDIVCPCDYRDADIVEFGNCF